MWGPASCSFSEFRPTGREALPLSENKPDFDPDAPSTAGSGIFGLSTNREEAGIRVLGVPFDATTSYRRGTAGGPSAVVAASHQVDLYDPQQLTWGSGDGRPWARGIHYEQDDQIAAWNLEAGQLAMPIIECGGSVSGNLELEKAKKRVDAIGKQVNERVHAWTSECLKSAALPVLLGGDHSIPLGGFQAAAEAHPGLGILHFDAHADLRPAYEGFRWSHASIMWNALDSLPGISQLHSVGLRDIGEGEAKQIEASEGRIRVCFAHRWAEARARGRDLLEFAAKEIDGLPDKIWLSLDIDGLDPSWCPNTGTPVPGGLTWEELLLWLGCLANSGKQVVGLDLCEVNPGPQKDDMDSWDAIVGARLLYKSIGAALGSVKLKI